MNLLQMFKSVDLIKSGKFNQIQPNSTKRPGENECCQITIFAHPEVFTKLSFEDLEIIEILEEQFN